MPTLSALRSVVGNTGDVGLLPFPDSLCHRCVHLRLVVAPRSTFLMCREPSLGKYAPQPVRACAKFW